MSREGPGRRDKRASGHGFLGQADSPVAFGAFLLLGINIALGALCYGLLKSGWKLKA